MLVWVRSGEKHNRLRCKKPGVDFIACGVFWRLQWFLPVRGMKILAIQFRYLGDAVLMTPALRALKEHFPDCELHVLVAEEAAPLLQHLPWLNRVWAFPRKRGKAKLRQSWPMIKALRRERYERSVDLDRKSVV